MFILLSYTVSPVLCETEGGMGGIPTGDKALDAAGQGWARRWGSKHRIPVATGR